MKNLLIGNGINIQFGGYDEYSNKAIIERLLFNLENKNYKELIKLDISKEELRIIFPKLVVILKRILKGNYDRYCKDYNDIIIVDRFKSQYNSMTTIYDIGMEDFFFIMHLFHNEYNDGKDLRKQVYDGMCWLFLDAIYNDGKIQNVFKNIKY